MSELLIAEMGGSYAALLGALQDRIFLYDIVRPLSSLTSWFIEYCVILVKCTYSTEETHLAISISL